MPITIGSNIMSLRAQRSLGEATNDLSRVYERLSSGQRINRASDDAAGLAISSSLRSNAKIYAQSVRNLNDGLSVLSIASGALNELTGIITRMKELSEQSANGTFVNRQRLSLDGEAQSLAKEFNRIISSTSFNKLSLFDSNSSSIRLQLGDTSANGGISVRTGNIGTGRRGDGTYRSAGQHSITSLNVTTADFNSDGVLDIVSSISGTGRIEIAFGNGDGTFKAKTTQSVLSSGTINDFFVGDFNGDGNKDLLISNSGGGGTFGISYGLGDGTFGSSVTIASGTFSGFGGAVGDIDNNGTDDFILTGQVYLGKTGSGMTLGSTYTQQGADTLYDFNGDGKLDLIQGGQNVLVVQYGNGNGTFSSSISSSLVGTSIEGFDTSQIRAGDINGDGKTDLVAYDFNTSQFQIFNGNGNGTFSIGSTVDSQGAFYLGITNRNFSMVDLNEDGRSDILFTDANGGDFQIAYGQADGTLASITTLSVSGGDASFTLGDFNGDGAIDIYGGFSSSSRTYLANTLNTSEIDTFSLRTRSDALVAMNLIQNSFDRLSQAKSFLGSDESRINFAKQVTSILRENYIGADSMIMDADVAQESARLVRVQILQKAAAAVLGQANLQPSIALTLLN